MLDRTPYKKRMASRLDYTGLAAYAAKQFGLKLSNFYIIKVKPF